MMTDEEKILDEKLKNDGREKRIVKIQLNPSCHIEAFYKDEKIMQLPLFYMIESFMKDYNYEPELKLEDELLIKILVCNEVILSFPLYVKKDDSKFFGSHLTLEELIKKGYLIQTKKVIVPNPILLQSNNEDKGGQNGV